MKTTRLWMALGAAVFGSTLGVGLTPQTAAAAWVRIPATECVVTSYNNSGISYSAGRLNQDWGGPSDLYSYCSVPSSSTIPHSSFDVANVHGLEPSGASNYSRACTTDYVTGSMSCGTTAYWGSGSSGASVNTSAWSSHGADFPFIYSRLAESSKIYGIFVYN